MSKTIDNFRGENRYLSNFGIYPVVYEGIDYPTSEHAYQAAKTLDLEERKKFAQFPHPRDAKKAGGELPPWLFRKDWDNVKVDVMRDIVRNKFTDPRNAAIRQRLLDTGDAELIEENNWGDKFWGVCDGKGLNHLGKILMEVREEIKSASKEPAPIRENVLKEPGELDFI